MRRFNHKAFLFVTLMTWTSAMAFSSKSAYNKRSLVASPLFIFNKRATNSGSSNLPKYDAETDRYSSTVATSKDFYPPYESLLRNGPLPLITRLTSPDKYEQAVFKYQYESKETDLVEAQANMDAFFSAPDVWAQQKMLEQRGEREVYKYGKPLDPERVALSSIWGGFVLIIIGKLIYLNVLKMM